MRALPIAAAITLGACVSQGVGPGVLNPHWQEPRRDPTPTRDPTREQTTSPWIAEDERPPPDPPRVDLAKRTIATIAAVVAGGWLPALVWHGVFEEVPDARDAHRRRAPAEPAGDAPAE